MLRSVSRWVLVCTTLISASATVIEFPRCNCDGDGLWSIESIVQCQKVSDFFIAAAYFSIPLELLYFATCTTVFPFKWVVIQFGAFIVLCGLTHLLAVFTYEPHSFLLMLGLTISKLLTALVSFATAITLLTLIPQLLRVKVRENLLRLKATELDREVGMMKRQEETSWHVRMLTQEIRKSLDRHTILYTTLVELSKTLALHNCAVWMPNESKTEMNLTHELLRRHSSDGLATSIPIADPDVVEVKRTEGAKILRSDSVLGFSSSGGDSEPGAVAAIRMQMLKISDFKRGTPEVIQTRYAILVLILPNDKNRNWSYHELEIVEVVADQVAVALSHAEVLEESQLMREKLVVQNRALLQARKNAMMASEARNSFQTVMSQGMRRPIHSILGLLSMMQQEGLGPEQQVIVNTMVKTSSVISTLINDVTEFSYINKDRFTLEVRPFSLHSMIKEAASVARCLCGCRGLRFKIHVESTVPDHVVGDEKRIFHVILHMVSHLLNGCVEGCLDFRVCGDSDVDDGQGQRLATWRSSSSDSYGCVRFEIGIKGSQVHDSCSSTWLSRRQTNIGGFDMGLSFSICRKLVQVMQGNIWAVPNSRGLVEKMTLVLRFQPPPPGPQLDKYLDNNKIPAPSILGGLRVLLADDDEVNRVVTQKLLERLGCSVSSVSSGIQCLSLLGASIIPFKLIVLDLHMPGMSGFEVAVRIRKLKSSFWPLIVALTASAESDVWGRCLQSGMNGLIRKPVVIQVLRDELLRVLQKS